MKKRSAFTLLLVCILAIMGCEDNNVPKHTDTLTSGSVSIMVDESYQPIIEEQLKVFDSSFPKAKINTIYKSESECLKGFINDKDIRLILITRELSAEEKEILASKKTVTKSLSIAKDAVALIVNKNARDSVFSLDQLKGILTGDFVRPYTVVFDNQGSSTLRYITDSLIPDQQLGSNVYAANGNDSVINYVSKNPNSIGFVGVSHVSDYQDPEGLAFINNVKVASVYNDSLDKAYKPYQAYIAPDWYPLTRRLYYIHKETHRGLGTGFANFLSKNRGQLIFKQARLFPTRVNIVFRPAEMNQ